MEAPKSIVCGTRRGSHRSLSREQTVDAAENDSHARLSGHLSHFQISIAGAGPSLRFLVPKLRTSLRLRLPPPPAPQRPPGGMHRTQSAKTKKAKNDFWSVRFSFFWLWEEMWVGIELFQIVQ
jgi:hypothetical protein